MYLKTLSLRGFKSFADPTTLEFAPGVSVIVGPNGSGKSNVVDAVAWVLGAQGPRVVRSAKMDDVIFAGTQKRAALGRAEVSLTIDNSTGKLPVDLAEVTITRTLFRTGESEYSMNGAPCRLLDIQELLSDAGVGRQQHVIMSQGQLDTVLQARPEDRRAVIEDAAGILKFRRRRERAERRIEATEANLQRLQDLHREVRRQLRPLERQAQAARQHGSLATELRAMRLYVSGQELRSLELRSAQAVALKTTLHAEDVRLSAEIARLDDLVAESEAALVNEQGRDVGAPLAAAGRLRERARGISNVIGERNRRIELALTASTETDVVSSLEAESARIDAELASTAEAIEGLQPERVELAQRQDELESREAAWRTSQPGGDTPDQLTPAQAGVEAARLRKVRDSVRDQLSKAREALARETEREASLGHQIEELQTNSAQVALRAENATATVVTARQELSGAEDAEREAANAVMSSEAVAREAVERAQGLAARSSALQLALDEAHARAGVEHLAGQAGVLGTLLDVVEIDDGCELAFEAGIAEALGSVVVEGDSAARAAIEHLRESGISGGILRAQQLALPADKSIVGARPDLLKLSVRSPHAGVASLLSHLLDGVVLCRGDVTAALDLAETLPVGAVVVTLDGDRFGALGWRLGAGRAGATRAALEMIRLESVLADQTASEASAAAEVARQQHTVARTAARSCARAFEAASAEERQARTQQEQSAQRLQLMREQAPAAALACAERSAKVTTLGTELEDADGALLDAENVASQLTEGADRAATARRGFDGEAREIALSKSQLEVRASALLERRQAGIRRRDDIEARLAGYEIAREQAADRRLKLEGAAVALQRLGLAVAACNEQLTGILAILEEERRVQTAAVSSIAGRLREARTSRTESGKAIEVVREKAQHTELELAELRVRLETSVDTLRHDLEVEPDVALEAECPPLPEGITAEARVAALDRELRLLGPVNPLALEELAGIEERDRFLTGQIEDVKSTRRDLAKVVKAVDEEIVSVFAEAFEDVSRHFEALFSTLFPGGGGRLTLLDPNDLLSTGIEIEARPAGRNVRRLSLLSGGERSLVALAFLFAVFRSRPSPFYLMDEVEAALDDINLHRFLDLVDEFRSEAQLLIVSHQKRTMESADVLYGVSLQPGGASKVVTERLRSDDAQTG